MLGATVEGGIGVEVRVRSPRGGTLRLWPSLGDGIAVDGVVHAGPGFELPTTAGQRLVLRRLAATLPP